MTDHENRLPFCIDMHVHTSRYSECAESLDPLKIEKYARKAGLDAVVITEHDTFWNRYELQELTEMCTEVQFFNGIEVTTKRGFHLVIIGVEKSGLLKKGVPCFDAIRYTHDQGGLAILAHPFRKGLPPLKTVAEVDAIEVGSTSLYEKESQLSYNLAKIMEKPAIACSDAHALSMIGWAYTRFPHPPENLRDLCEMVKEGKGKPILPNPFFG